VPFNEAMAEVLQGRRYDRLMGRTTDIWRTIADFIERIMTALFDRINIPFPQGGGDLRAVPIIFSFVGGLLVVIGVVVMGRLLWQARKKRAYDLSDIFAELAGGDYTVGDLMRLSDEATNRRGAVRYRYIAALLALNEAGLIRISPSATNALILRGLKKAHPTLTKPFTDLAEGYHLTWYGFREMDDTTYAAYCTACRTLVEAQDA